MLTVEPAITPPEPPSAWQSKFKNIANRERYLARARIERIFETGEGELESRNCAGQRVIYSLRGLVEHFSGNLDNHDFALQLLANLTGKESHRTKALDAFQPALNQFIDDHARAMAYVEMDTISREGNPWTT